ncbi:MAG TPA: tRNA preQ1(34) S-adenosylmethionine ribosyltransferase-isomerase QueA [Gemmataceae bacterium]|jgi:S-adenosylmethionine:tRNA ribosyltransferase-isomerase|nr:tRNA preQ1(34) S-adenosylmethionine ribosyltransferase-isomerase QueA [Gemmataceae bacterium]
MSELFFDYELPPHLIASEPVAERDQSRLLVVERSSGNLRHAHFVDLPEFLRSGDLLVLNNTRVLPARLYGRRQKTGGKWEGLFLHEIAGGIWELLCQTRGWLQPGDHIAVEPGEFLLEVVSNAGSGRWLMKPLSPGTPAELLERFGHVPLPPYIRNGKDSPADRARYQTVYAERPGAVAAPTAGLHFTQRVFDRLRDRGVAVAFVTLHVGLGTFQPIKADNPADHVMHREAGELPPETAQAIAACRSHGGRVVAVGTTSVRVLETAALHPGSGWVGDTDLFIRPPFAFQQVGGLVTNFHLPKTTLLLLVQAFAGVDLMRRAYREAIDREYRFYSYGDAMLIL